MPDRYPGRCTARHNPGTWPYTARCMHPEHEDDNHQDRAGNRWKGPTAEQEEKQDNA